MSVFSSCLINNIKIIYLFIYPFIHYLFYLFIIYFIYLLFILFIILLIKTPFGEMNYIL